MGRASSRKKAQRAARAASSRQTRRRRRRWPLAVLALVAVGIALFVMSATGRLDDLAGADLVTAPSTPDVSEEPAP